MTIGDLLIQQLLADTTIAGMVNTRIYPLRLPQSQKGRDSTPAIVVTRISGERIGQLNGTASAAEPRYQIDAWAGTQKAATDLGNAIRNVLESFVGIWSDHGSPATEAFVQVQFITERDSFEEDILGGLCRHSADYFIFHSTNGAVM